MIGNDGRVRVCDFGIAGKLKKCGDLNKQIGSVPYMAPEVLEAEHYGFKVDIWSLGCVLYEMVTHERAFEHRLYGKLIKLIKAGDYKPLPADTSASLKDLIANMIKVNVDDRFSVNQCLEHRWF